MILLGYVTKLQMSAMDYFEIDGGQLNIKSRSDLERDINNIGQSDLEFTPCNLLTDMGSDWRVLIPGCQSTIQIIRSHKNLGEKVLNLASIVSIIHKKLVMCLLEALQNGMQTVLVIKSRPFTFYRPVTNLCKCVFVYKEEWDSNNLDYDYVLLSGRVDDNFRLETDNESDIPDRCNYTSNEPLMEVMTGAKFSDCVNLSKPKYPIHYNGVVNASMDCIDYYNVIMLDFWNQDCTSHPLDWNYLSVGGPNHVKVWSSKYWGFSQEVTIRDLKGTDLEQFCICTGQSLKDIYVVCTSVLNPYINM
ncbi:hypothetical protein IV203_008060 [Nitzschia inconspicua]|uniref:Uncharacterized protein n=1 Tax=Nitzschia inconspicua TaxID=303405 RepID=A0A9K3KYS2_9STRA|nr:hypothetical protein IV203_008060 [Nitzschia inconspicua]